MDILPNIFRWCRLCGIWYEDSSNFLLKLLYSGSVAFVIIYFTLSELVELARMRDSLNEMSEVLFVGLNYTAVCLKALNFTSRRGDMRSLLNDFRLPLYQTRSPAEEALVGRYNFIHNMLLGYMYVSQAAGLIMIVAPLAGGHRQPFRAYQPFDASESTGFAVAYVLQVLAIIYGILISVSLDMMACAFMILTAVQIDLNCYRIVNSSMPLKKCIEHQVLLRNTIYKIQEFFIPAVVPLFFFSTITVCTSIFRMSQTNAASLDFVSIVTYIVCMLLQVFIYCWFGNELELKNQDLKDALYFSNWINHERERKHICFMMLFTKHAATISFHGQCTLTLNTFIWITKTSYAAFNVLSHVIN